MKKQDPDAAYAQAIQEAVAVDPLSIDDEFASLPGQIVRYNNLFSDAMKTLLLAEAAEDRMWAKMYILHREESRDEKAKITETEIKSLIESSKEWQRVHDAVIDAKIEKQRLHGVLDALSAKRDALISIGAKMRAELAGQPHLREMTRTARDIKKTRGTQDDD